MATCFRTIKWLFDLCRETYKNSKKYSGPWNFGSKKNTVTNVLTIVKRIVKKWGKGRIIFKKQKFYEQINLQLNINKSQEILKWKPKLSILESVDFTVEWYKKVLIEKEDIIKITKYQINKFMNEK